MIITHKFDMAVDRRGPAPIVDAVQGESNTRVVQISLYTTPEHNKKEPWVIPDGVSPMIRFRKKDGTGGIYDVLPDGSDAVTLAGNVITAVLAPQMLTVPGTVLAQVELTAGTKSMATFSFHVEVEYDPSVGAMESKDYYNLSKYVSQEVERILGDFDFDVDLSEYAKKDELPKTLPNPHALTIDEQTYDGSEAKNMTAAVEAVVERKMMSVKRFGAKGDGSTDDTVAFREALASERVVYVPGGTYLLSAGLVIGENCELELAQDTVLNFTQTSGNCITLGMSSSLKGNHATVNVPYAFSGNVVYASSTTTEDTSAPPPFTRWSPQWKSGRYVSDLNICKADNRGFHYSVDGKCNGTAVYLSADGNAHLTFMWGVHYTGLRIAGAFTYGVRAVNFNEGWLHEMRIDAFIDGCETGVSLENCNNAYVSAIIEPRRALLEDNKTYVPYAKHGIKLIRSKNADLSGSRVWDWDATNTLWTAGGEYQHLCMYGECRGAIINAFQYYETSYDIRDLIYTDTASNLEKITILQEPFDRWFKNRGNEPYFFDGYTEKKLATQEELDQHFTTDRVKGFTDVLATAIDTDGTIYNGIGYRIGCRLDGYDIITETPYYGVTGFIPCKVGSKIYAADLSWATRDGYCRVNFYDKDLNMLINGQYGVSETAEKIVTGSSSLMSYEETSNGFVCTVLSAALVADVAYVRFTFRDVGFGAKPTMAVDEEIRYTVEGFLADGIRVKAENVVGDVGGTTPDWNAAEGEAGHIKGRTHYHKDGAIIMPKTTCEVSEGMADATLNAPFVADKTYRVIFNGQQYYCTAKLTEGNVYIGNNALVEAEGDTGEPFVIIPTDLGELGYSGVIILADATATECTLSIVEIEYITLPVEYLPSTHQRYIVNVPEGEVDTSSTIWGLSENSDNVAPIIYGGGDVLLKIVNISGAVSFYQLLSPSIASGVVVGFVAKDGRTLSSVTFAAGTWTPPTT